MMLVLPRDTDVETLKTALARGGFGPIEVDVEDDGLHVHGLSRTRENEWGDPAHLEEEDRADVESALSAHSSMNTNRARARELKNKPTMTQPELAEAVQLLLSIVLEEDST